MEGGKSEQGEKNPCSKEEKRKSNSNQQPSTTLIQTLTPLFPPLFYLGFLGHSTGSPNKNEERKGANVWVNLTQIRNVVLSETRYCEHQTSMF